MNTIKNLCKLFGLMVALSLVASSTVAQHNSSSGYYKVGGLYVPKDNPSMANAVTSIPGTSSATAFPTLINVPSLKNFTLKESIYTANEFALTFAPKGSELFNLHLDVKNDNGKDVFSAWCSGDEKVCKALGNGKNCDGTHFSGPEAWCYYEGEGPKPQTSNSNSSSSSSPVEYTCAADECRSIDGCVPCEGEFEMYNPSDPCPNGHRSLDGNYEVLNGDADSDVFEIRPSSDIRAYCLIQGEDDWL